MPGAATRLAAALDRSFGTPPRAEPLPQLTPATADRPVVWLVCPDAAAVQSLGGLLALIEDELPQVRPMVTGPGAELPDPGEDRRSIRTMLSVTSPAAVVLIGTPFRPLVVGLAAKAGIAVMGLSLRASQRSWMQRWWARPLSRPLLSEFDRLLCEDSDAVSAMRRAGAQADRVELGGLLAGDVDVPRCNEAEREEIAEILSSRPVWCAVGLPPEEVPIVLAAHKIAMQRAHRLLLILVPNDPADGPAMLKTAEEGGWHASLRSEGDYPTEENPVYIADLPDELGLWLRAAPTTWMGGSLSGGSLVSPVHAAALGSAILHGPAEGAFRTDYARLRAANAVRLVQGADDIAREVERLLAPDEAAEMAHAAWEVTSAGEEAAVRGIEAIRRILRERSG